MPYLCAQALFPLCTIYIRSDYKEILGNRTEPYNIIYPPSLDYLSKFRRLPTSNCRLAASLLKIPGVATACLIWSIQSWEGTSVAKFNLSSGQAEANSNHLSFVYLPFSSQHYLPSLPQKCSLYHPISSQWRLTSALRYHHEHQASA